MTKPSTTTPSVNKQQQHAYRLPIAWTTIAYANSQNILSQIGRSSAIEVKNDEYDIDKTLQIPYHFTDMQRLKVVAYTIPDDEDTDPQEAGVAITTMGLVSNLLYCVTSLVTFVSILSNHIIRERDTPPQREHNPLIFALQIASTRSMELEFSNNVGRLQVSLPAVTKPSI